MTGLTAIAGAVELAVHLSDGFWPRRGAVIVLLQADAGAHLPYRAR